MAGRSLEDRVDILEKKVESLEVLPARIDSLTANVASLTVELSQFRAEARAEFFALRAEFRVELRTEVRGSRNRTPHGDADAPGGRDEPDAGALRGCPVTHRADGRASATAEALDLHWAASKASVNRSIRESIIREAHTLRHGIVSSQGFGYVLGL